MKIGTTIKRLRKEKGWTQTELGKMLGVSDKTVSSWEIDRTEPSFDNIDKMSELFGRPLMPRFDNIPEPTTDHSQWVPILGNVAAGIPIEMIEDITDYEEIESSIGDAFGLVINGDSMYPDIPKGTTVIVKQQDDVESGQVAIVAINGEDATCKKVVKHSSGISLVSFNPSYEPRFFTTEEVREIPVRILGRVVEMRRKL